MTFDAATPRDPFEVALAQHLKSQTEQVPPRLSSAVDQSIRTVVPVARTGWTGRLLPQSGASMAAFSTLVVSLLVVLGAAFFLGGPSGEEPAAIVAPGAASEPPAEPTPTHTVAVLDDGTVVDPEVVALIDELVGDIEIEPTPSPTHDAPIAEVMIEPELVAALPIGSDPSYLVEGPQRGAIYIDRATGSVHRANMKNGKIADIVHEGDKQKGTDRTIGEPVQLAAAGPDVVIVDDKARPWRWRPSNSAGAGTLAKLSLQGRAGFEANHGDLEAYDPAVGDYRMYVAEPEFNQIMRYQQTFDGSSFQEPSPYLASQTAQVSDFDQLYIDFDVYALFGDELRRHQYGKYDGTFMLAVPPDDADLRPGQEYRIVDGSGRASSSGRVYLYESLHGRVVGFSKVDGSYLGQWLPEGDGDEMDDIRGMYVIEGGLTRKGKRKSDSLVWVTPDGIYRAVLAFG